MSATKEDLQEELKLEDILKSIRGIIDDHNHDASNVKNNSLEDEDYKKSKEADKNHKLVKQVSPQNDSRSSKTISNNQEATSAKKNTEINSEDVLELTNCVEDRYNPVLSPVRGLAQKETSKAPVVNKKNMVEPAFNQKKQQARSSAQSNATQNSLERRIEAMMVPLLKEWMDANLPKLVKEVAREQIKKHQ